MLVIVPLTSPFLLNVGRASKAAPARPLPNVHTVKTAAAPRPERHLKPFAASTRRAESCSTRREVRAKADLEDREFYQTDPYYI